MTWRGHIRTDEKGQSLVEYLLVIALVAVVLIAALVLYREQVWRIVDDIDLAGETEDSGTVPGRGGGSPDRGSGGRGGLPPGQAR
jgi:Flp pilus assembly pilin Flp